MKKPLPKLSIPVPAAGAAGPIRVYSHLLEPREHPDYGRRAVRPPSWSDVGHRTQFTCLRFFEIKDGRLVGFAEEMEKYTRTHGLGRVIWPSYPVLFAVNLGELADEIKRRDLYLFDVWGYVPGSGPGDYWQQFRAPPEALALLESRLGERWLGTDIGEQDGRYLSLYASQMTPASAGRLEQYLNFQRHFERMGDDLGHKHAVLVSLNFGHYLLKEGTYTLIGAETAQALPNNQVYYAFIRGAGKQYGVPWFGNASVYNRWGFKSYNPPGRGDGYLDFTTECGPTKGTSLSLLKRLLYTHLLYNGMFAGFENNWIEGGRLTPVGAVQQAAQRWVEQHGQPGVMHTPVALLLDFYAGWTFPRHLYTEKVYRVWGNLPYTAGDFLTDAVLDLLYPGYQDSSYFHDESGFIAPTPYGDIADCLLSDAPDWLLARYPVVVVGGELAGGREIRDKLEAYAAGGGQLVITAGNLAKLPGGLAGLGAVGTTTTVAFGQGKITVFAGEFGMQPALPGVSLQNVTDRPLAKPHALGDEVRRGLIEIFRQQSLFEVAGEGLSVVTCRKQAGEYTLGIANNTWRESRFRITSRSGTVESITELPLDSAEKTAAGYLPEGVDGGAVGRSGPDTIAGGDIRIFSVRLAEAGVRDIPHAPPAPRPSGRLLTLRHTRNLKEEILARPTFFAHFDGVVVDWRYLHDRAPATLRGEAGWIRRQSLRVVVDLSSGVNLYPDLRLVDNLAGEYAASMAVLDEVLAKMTALGARDLMLSLHRVPENNFTAEQTTAALERTMKALAAKAASRDITLHLRMTGDKAPQRLADLAGLIDRVGGPNVKLAPALSMLLAEVTPPAEAAPWLAGRLGLWLGAAVRRDVTGQVYDLHAPLHTLPAADQARLREWLGAGDSAPIVLDAILANQDEEYLDAVVIESAKAERS